MESVDRTIRYLFILGFVLIVVAYYVGSTGLLKTLFSGATSLDYAATGRTSSGTFAPYPTGGTTS
jgi:hypothetical protein